MKKITIIALLSLCCSVVKAQLNQSQSQIKQVMSNEKDWRFVDYGTATDGRLDGAKFLYYQEQKQLIEKAFYFFNDSCKLIKFSYRNERLKKVAKDMNSKFISKGNNIWIDEKDHSKYELLLDKEGVGTFDVLETPYSTYN
jgi:hypothetical protein